MKTLVEFDHYLSTEFTEKDFADTTELFEYLERPVVAESKESVPLFSPVTYPRGKNRSKAHKVADGAIEGVTLAAFEVDHLALDAVQPLLDRVRATGLWCCVYTTHSHRSRGPK